MGYIWGPYHNVPKAMFYLLKGDYKLEPCWGGYHSVAWGVYGTASLCVLFERKQERTRSLDHTVERETIFVMR